MEFKIKVTVFGEKIYDIEANSELEAKLKGKVHAETDYAFNGKELYFGYASMLCSNCKNSIYTGDKFCSQCGKKVERGER